MTYYLTNLMKTHLEYIQQIIKNVLAGIDVIDTPPTLTINETIKITTKNIVKYNNLKKTMFDFVDETQIPIELIDYFNIIEQRINDFNTKQHNKLTKMNEIKNSQIFNDKCNDFDDITNASKITIEL